MNKLQAIEGAAFVVGDVVTLKSGGPPMTIVKVRPDYYGDSDEPGASVMYFDDMGDMTEKFVPFAALKREG